LPSTYTLIQLTPAPLTTLIAVVPETVAPLAGAVIWTAEDVGVATGVADMVAIGVALAVATRVAVAVAVGVAVVDELGVELADAFMNS